MDYFNKLFGHVCLTMYCTQRLIKILSLFDFSKSRKFASNATTTCVVRGYVTSTHCNYYTEDKMLIHLELF